MRTLGTVVVAALVAAVTSIAMQLWVAPRLPVASVEAPSFLGVAPAQARAIAEQRGLRVIFDAPRSSDRVPPGTIAEQQPLPGSMLRRGDEVHAHLAASREVARVPRVAGMTPDAARELLERARLRVGARTPTADAQTPAGLVIGTAPEAEREVALETAVELKVSTGAATAPVPALFGKRLSTAKELLSKAGFNVGEVRRGNNDDRDPGEVIGQTPKANDPAPLGSKVDLVVNSD